tara:strand:+ start:9925 stop:10818 length:894 start_codon:yes stop_codon:yes gene_type:complete
MALATTTAILAAASLALSAGTTVVSGVQAAKQRKIMEGAEGEAEKYMEDARDRLDINTYEELSINRDIYDKERDTLAAVGESYVELTANQDRAGGNVQNVFNAVQSGNEKISMREAKEVDRLNLEVADEETRLLDIGTQLDLGEVVGAQQKAADAEAKATAFKGDFIEGAINTAMKGVEIGVPLYKKSQQTKALKGTGAADIQTNIAGGNIGKMQVSETDKQMIAGLKGTELNEFLKTKFSGANMQYMLDPTKGNFNAYSPPAMQAVNNSNTLNAGALQGLGLSSDKIEQILALIKG